jgi:alanine dehydrogenase
VRIGVPKEVKDAESRVALTPAGAQALTDRGHEVVVERGAGVASGLEDAAYEGAGCRIEVDADAVWGEADLVLKVKEPVAEEFRHFRADLTLFTYLHLASAAPLTQALLASGCTAIAYETVTSPRGDLPLLAPMSRIAGCMAAQVAACELYRPRGGNGALLGGVPGVRPARAAVLGAGMAGFHAARVLAALGAAVTVLDIDLERLARVDAELQGRVDTLHSSPSSIEATITTSDVVVGAVLVPGARAPRLLSTKSIRAMPRRSVLVDVSIDQGGCAATSRVTTHSDPTYMAEGVLHYCVGNMPGAVPRASTPALANATLGYAMLLAEHGPKGAVIADPGLADGVSVARGVVTHAAVADAHDLPWTDARSVL